MMNPERQSLRELTTPINREKEDPLTLLKQVLCTLASGREALEMARVSKSGLMELATSENGVKTERMAEESLFMLMAMCTMASGLMIKPTAQANTSTLMELSMKESGKTISNMARA